MDLATILKAIAIAGDFTPAAMQLYDGFIAVTTGSDQATLEAAYEAAKARSNDLHDQVQGEFGGQ